MCSHGRPQGGEQKGHLTPLEIETENENFLEKMKSAAQFQSVDLILPVAVYLPVWHSHCTQARFTVLVLCTDELAVHSCPLLCLRKQVVKFASGLFYCRSLLRNNNMATNLQRLTSSNGRKRFAACDYWKAHISALTFRDFVPRLELLSPFRNFLGI